MSEEEGEEATWLFPLLGLLFIAPVIIFLFVGAISWISSALYKVPSGVVDTVSNELITACFAATDELSSRQLDAIDLRIFTDVRASGCFSPSAYKLTIADKMITTAEWDTEKSGDKVMPLAVHIIESGKITNAQLILEVQT
ncbi:MAG TPA: hypothetical protein VJH88_03580 [Candidatus Nanoarchaeia archaeon]|nr:hypothetical protein [Candidatus Nanoarchaeia archaeon]